MRAARKFTGRPSFANDFFGRPEKKPAAAARENTPRMEGAVKAIAVATKWKRESKVRRRRGCHAIC